MIDPIPAHIEFAIFLFLVSVGVVGLSLQAWLWQRHFRGTSSSSPSSKANE